MRVDIRDSLWDLILSFRHAGSRDGAQPPSAEPPHGPILFWGEVHHLVWFVLLILLDSYFKVSSMLLRQMLKFPNILRALLIPSPGLYRLNFMQFEVPVAVHTPGTVVSWGSISSLSLWSIYSVDWCQWRVFSISDFGPTCSISFEGGLLEHSTEFCLSFCGLFLHFPDNLSCGQEQGS